MSLQYPREFLDSLLLDKIRSVQSKIELLDWEERVIGEIQGKTTDGSLNIDGTSAIRRTLSLSMVVDEYNFDITSLSNQVSLNKKAKVYIGVTNSLYNYKQYGEVIWFPLGVYVLTEGSITHSVGDNRISLNAQDKMCLLNGDVSGQLSSTTEFHWEDYQDPVTHAWSKKYILIHDIIRYAVVGLGEENPAKVIISDVPLKIKEPLIYVGTVAKYFDQYNNEVSEGDPSVVRVLAPKDYAGYRMVDFTYPTDLVKAAGDSIMSVLDDIVKVLGNYEYFYDVDGNFIFQEKKNFLNTNFTPLTQLTSGDYVADFQKTPSIYDLKDKHIVSSYSNTPNWKNIKNDFTVWGSTANGGAIAYHLVIDDKPMLPPDYDKPWQQYIIEAGRDKASKGLDPGRYYNELAAKFPQIYDDQINDWKTDQSHFNYWFDMIDTKTELGKFGVPTIGRRVKSIVDENVSMLYPPEIPDIVVIPTGSDQDYIDYLVRLGIKYQIVDAAEYEATYAPGSVGKDAFTVIRELVYFYTTFSEVITLQCLPLYFLEANNRIEVEDERSNIYGSYVITSISIPLGSEGLMNINAIRVASRI